MIGLQEVSVLIDGPFQVRRLPEWCEALRYWIVDLKRNAGEFIFVRKFILGDDPKLDLVVQNS
jgi:hypothetical protein